MTPSSCAQAARREAVLSGFRRCLPQLHNGVPSPREPDDIATNVGAAPPHQALGPSRLRRRPWSVGRSLARSVGRSVGWSASSLVAAAAVLEFSVVIVVACFNGFCLWTNGTVDIRVSPVSILGQLHSYTPLGRWVGVGVSPTLFLFYVNPFVFLRQLDGSSSDPTLKFEGVVGNFFGRVCCHHRFVGPGVAF